MLQKHILEPLFLRVHNMTFKTLENSMQIMFYNHFVIIGAFIVLKRAALAFC